MQRSYSKKKKVLAAINCFFFAPLRDINQTLCESRGCCYQSLNLVEPGAPVCHRKIPTLHGMRVVDPQNLTTAALQFSHPDNLQQWPKVASEEESKKEDIYFEYRLRRLGSQHFAVLLFGVSFL